MSKDSMILVQASWEGTQTFRMIPITQDCPYVECIMDPSTKVFVIISKIKKTTMHMLPKLDDNGDPAALKTARLNGRKVKEERRTIETFQEYYVEDATAIEELINLFASNATTFDYKSFMVKDKAAA